MDIKLVGERVMVAPDPEEEATKSGIIIPDKSRKKPNTGTAVAVGSGKEVNTGDRVMYSPGSGLSFSREGVEYLLMREVDILAVLPE